MATGLRMVINFTMLIAVFILLLLYDIVGGIIFPVITSVLKVTSGPANVVDPAVIGYLPSMYFTFCLLAMIVVLYKTWRDFAESENQTARY
jgi:phosphotransferase system  glucose/maltose/N-acetylglucosamine-specific IIC component